MNFPINRLPSLQIKSQSMGASPFISGILHACKKEVRFELIYTLSNRLWYLWLTKNDNGESILVEDFPLMQEKEYPSAGINWIFSNWKKIFSIVEIELETNNSQIKIDICRDRDEQYICGNMFKESDHIHFCLFLMNCNNGSFRWNLSISKDEMGPMKYFHEFPRFNTGDYSNRSIIQWIGENFDRLKQNT